MVTAKKMAPKAATAAAKRAANKIQKPVAVKKAPVSKTAKALAKITISLAKLGERKTKVIADINALKAQRADIKAQASVSAPAKASTKVAVKAAVKAPAKAAVKRVAKAPAKVAVKAAAKVAVKAAVKAPAKRAVKAPAKVAVVATAAAPKAPRKNAKAVKAA